VKIAGTIFCAWLITIEVIAQNIVPNPSFEEYDHCPAGLGNFSVSEWSRVGNSPDYYHECGGFGAGIPISAGGGGYANTGLAYAAIVVYTQTFNDYREFISIGLTSSLISGKKYKVEFYLSLADSVTYAAKNIGVYFSVDSIEPQFNNDLFFSVTPQIKYTGTDYLSDKEGWMKVEGSFFADGGERFITIGNFDDDSNTDTINVGALTGGTFEKTQSYYFIDDVSVELDTLTGLEEHEKVKFEIYPNPAISKVTIETEQTNEARALQMFDITGRAVLFVTLSNTKTSIDISQLPAGVYIAALLQDEAIASRRKIIIE
jgi:hypothetical protein